MTNSIISGYRLADVERTQRVFTDIGIFNNKTKQKVARSLRTNFKKVINVFSAI